MALIAGYEGAVTIDGVAIGFLTNAEVNGEWDIQTVGPFIGNSATSKVRTGKNGSGSCEGVATTPFDAGQEDVIIAFQAGANAELVIEFGDPAVKTFTGPETIISNFTMGLDTGEGAPFSFEFEVDGAFTIA